MLTLTPNTPLIWYDDWAVHIRTVAEIAAYNDGECRRVKIAGKEYFTLGFEKLYEDENDWEKVTGREVLFIRTTMDEYEEKYVVYGKREGSCNKIQPRGSHRLPTAQEIKQNNDKITHKYIEKKLEKISRKWNVRNRCYLTAETLDKLGGYFTNEERYNILEEMRPYFDGSTKTFKIKCNAAEVNQNLKKLQRLGKALIDQYKKEVQPKLYWLPEGA